MLICLILERKITNISMVNQNLYNTFFVIGLLSHKVVTF